MNLLCSNVLNHEPSSHRIGHVDEYPTMHYFGNPRHTQSVVAYMFLTISGNSGELSHCGNVVNMPYSQLEELYAKCRLSESGFVELDEERGQTLYVHSTQKINSQGS